MTQLIQWTISQNRVNAALTFQLYFQIFALLEIFIPDEDNLSLSVLTAIFTGEPRVSQFY